MFRLISFYFLFLAFSVVPLTGQSNLPIGKWKSHLSYKEGRRVTQSDKNIIYASEKGIFTISKDDISVNFLAKEDGFTNVDVSQLYYDKVNKQLVIIYYDNTIDIYRNDDIVNIPFIKLNTTVQGSKSINDMFIAETGEAFLATDFGILGFDLKKLEFPFTTFTELKVLSVAMLDGIIYGGTEEGLYSVPLKGSNVTDFNIWSSISTSRGLPQSYDVKSLAVKFSSLFALIDNKIYKMDGKGQFNILYSSSDKKDIITYISDDGSQIMVGIENNNNSRTLFIDKNDKITVRSAGCINRGVYAVEDEKGRVWYADQWDPVRYTEGKIDGDCKTLQFPVPFTNEASNVKFKKNKAYLGSGGVNDDYQYKFTRYGFYTLENNEWKNFNASNILLIGEKDFFHLFTLAPHPTTPELYLGSYYNGIINYNEETKQTQFWNKDNSILGSVVGDDARTRIAGLKFDKNENLWISNYGALKPLVVKTKDDTWYNFSVPSITSLADILIDNAGNKWVAVVGIGGGVLVFNEGDKIADPTDDKIRFITRNNSEIKGNKVNSLAVDLDGSVWVGTDQGPVVFDCGDPFSESCTGNIRKVVVDGIPALLLRDEDILSIEVDGGNRKWFGTRNGIFVQSSDGVTQEAKFDTKNSPLLDNKVTDIAFNPVSGEMFIITPAGIQSYKTETTGGGRSFASSVFAFPNPVRPDYSGPIAIKGLVRDANVKITDINGKLVYETKALGGLAIWDGRDYNGIKATTGVYLVFSANENASNASSAVVTKILIIK
jgi:hypothetical protein